MNVAPTIAKPAIAPTLSISHTVAAATANPIPMAAVTAAARAAADCATKRRSIGLTTCNRIAATAICQTMNRANLRTAV